MEVIKIPIYDYKCDNCGLIKEFSISVRDRNNLWICSHCSNWMRRCVSTPLFILKGDCWASKQGFVNVSTDRERIAKGRE